jgi:type III secretory pathway component EscT
MGLLIMLTLVFLPHIAVTSETFVGYNLTYILLCFKELFIGTILFFLSSVPFFIAESAGITIDFLRGSSSLQVTDPYMQSQTSDIGLLYNYTLIALFYEIGGPFYFFSAVFDSYTLVPADGWLSPGFFTFTLPFWQTLSQLVTTITAIGIQLAAPSLLAILMTEVFLGIANRLAPQVQIAFLGMSLKSLVGLAMLCAAWYFILQQLSRQSLQWLGEMNKMLQWLQV